MIGYSILIIGPQHVGKSTIGSLLADALHIPFVDADIALMDIHNHNTPDEHFDSVRELYATKGKVYFQEMEARALETLPIPCICATGGGLADNHLALQYLSTRLLTQKDTSTVGFFTILLTAAPHILWERIISKGIPAYLHVDNSMNKKTLSDDALRSLFSQFKTIYLRRMQTYKELASICIQTTENDITRSPEEISKQILLAIEEKS